MIPEEQKLFQNNKRKYKVKETGEIIDVSRIENIVSIYQERLKKLSEIGELVDFFFKGKLNYNKNLLKWKDMTEKDLVHSIDKIKNVLSSIDERQWNREEIKNRLLEDHEIMDNKGKFLWPLRVCLSGKESSAPPFEIAEILGRDKTLKRIEQVSKFLD